MTVPRRPLSFIVPHTPNVMDLDLHVWRLGDPFDLALSTDLDTRLPLFNIMLLLGSVGGHLLSYIENWTHITSDCWIVNVILHGYKMHFNKDPHLVSCPVAPSLGGSRSCLPQMYPEIYPSKNQNSDRYPRMSPFCRRPYCTCAKPVP